MGSTPVSVNLKLIHCMHKLARQVLPKPRSRISTKEQKVMFRTYYDILYAYFDPSCVQLATCLR